MASTNQEAERTRAAKRFARAYVLFAHALLVTATVAFPTTAPLLAGMVLLALLVAASYSDLRWRRVPNWLTYSALGWTLLLAALATPRTPASLLTGVPAIDPLQLTDALTGGAVCFAGMLILYRLSGTGGGDVKLAAAIGALVGVQAGVSTILWCHLLAAGGTLAWRAATGDGRRAANRIALRIGLPLPFPGFQGHAELPRVSPTTQIPLAAFFAGGVVLTLSGASLV